MSEPSEVGAPAVPRFQRTVNFYVRNGFVEVGPRLSHALQRDRPASVRSGSPPLAGRGSVGAVPGERGQHRAQ
jgi:hypothetical protein